MECEYNKLLIVVGLCNYVHTMPSRVCMRNGKHGALVEQKGWGSGWSMHVYYSEVFFVVRHRFPAS